MKRISGVFATTNVDAHGEQVTREALEDMASRLAGIYLPMYVEHDPRTIPIGRVISARAEPLPNGQFGLLGEMEIWELGDKPEVLEGDGRHIPSSVDAGLEVCCDGRLLGTPLHESLVRAVGTEGRVRYRAQKSAEIGLGILVGLGLFTVVQLGSGLLNEAGADVYRKLKSAIGGWIKNEHRLNALEFKVGVILEHHRVEVHCYLPDPTENDVNSFFTTGLDSLVQVVRTVAAENPRAVRIFVQWLDGRWQMHYWLRDDGVPSRIEAFPIDKLDGMGLSFGAAVDLADIEVND